MLSNGCVTVAILVCAMTDWGAAQEASEVRFGTTVVIPAGLRGIIYYLRPGTTRLPDFAALKPRGTIYASIRIVW